MEVDQRRTCYNCEGFVYMARHYRNRRIEKERRIEYGGNWSHQDNKRGEEFSRPH